MCFLAKGREAQSEGVKKQGACITSALSVKRVIAAKYRNTTPRLIISTYSQSGTNDYVVSYLLFKILHHNVTGCFPTETSFLTQKNRKRVHPENKGVCLQRVETGNEGVQCGSQKKSGFKSSRFRGSTGVCVSSLSNQANPGEKTILDQNDLPRQFILTCHSWFLTNSIIFFNVAYTKPLI